MSRLYESVEVGESSKGFLEVISRSYKGVTQWWGSNGWQMTYNEKQIMQLNAL